MKQFTTETGKTITYGDGQTRIVSRGIALSIDPKRKQHICLSDRVISKDLYDQHYAPPPAPAKETPVEEVPGHGVE